MNEQESKLSIIAEKIWKNFLKHEPGSAVMFGERDYVDQMEDVSLQSEHEKVSEMKAFLDDLSHIDKSKLDTRWKVSHAIIEYELKESLASIDSRFIEWAVGMMGPQESLILTHPQISLETKEQADGILKRVELHARFFNQLKERMTLGIKDGLINNQRNVERTINSLENYLKSDVSVDPLLGCSLPQSMTKEETESWRNKGIDIVKSKVRPVVRDFVEFLTRDLAPLGRQDDKFGVQWMEGGVDYYAKFLPLHTGTPGVSPDEVHEIGKQEVQSLVEQYEVIGPRVFNDISKFSQIVERLRTDKAMRYKSAKEMVEMGQQAVDRAFKEARDAFGIYPDAPCKVVEVPAEAAEDAPPAFYMSPAFDGSRPGMYFLNTYKPEEKDMFECEALAFHEAIPGHHLDRTIAVELKDVPQIQRIAGTTAFVEGWGLYAETLADEIGLYTNDVQQLGRLSSNIFRAARLVLDTGIHAKGWSRAKAVDYFQKHVPITLVDIETEIDRYSSWPGQACAYKMGERKMFELRKRAKKALGDKFSLPEFHDEVLKDGGLTLGILETKINDWIKRNQS